MRDDDLRLAFGRIVRICDILVSTTFLLIIEMRCPLRGGACRYHGGGYLFMSESVKGLSLVKCSYFQKVIFGVALARSR